ncbi:energy-coupling factor transporter ATPase [Lactobacillus sp. 3B(2020)]|uniref:energy-coupling factor transporter ATPase n=1 Tax=Lactobacillus sp. 3B(2020) TaxID=2695882 RepID=UPI0021072EAF|nr:energy-coupling factor transporter ATPase [Lactobacillus sp. 3B(2020)]
MKTAMIKIENLNFKYAHQNKLTLNDLTLQVPAGQWLAIVGKNGSGKSTLARLIDGLLETPSKTIWVDGLEVNTENIAAIHQKIGFVFQNPDNQFVGATVAADVAFGLENRQVSSSEMPKIIEQALTLVKMQAFRDRAPEQLSGGQKQRVAIAGALALKPQLLVLDEATSMLDPEGRKDVLTQLAKLRDQGELTIISITHDPDEVALADQVAVLDQGKIVKQASPAVVLNDQALIQRIGLVQPFSLILRDQLKARGIKVPTNYLGKGALYEWINQQLATKA